MRALMEEETGQMESGQQRISAFHGWKLDPPPPPVLRGPFHGREEKQKSGAKKKKNIWCFFIFTWGPLVIKCYGNFVKIHKKCQKLFQIVNTCKFAQILLS